LQIAPLANYTLLMLWMNTISFQSFRNLSVAYEGRMKPVLWIRIGLKQIRPDPSFYLNTDPGNQTNADPDPDPGQTKISQQVNFYRKNIHRCNK
jgi:hypothetical protein